MAKRPKGYLNRFVKKPKDDGRQHPEGRMAIRKRSKIMRDESMKRLQYLMKKGYV